MKNRYNIGFFLIMLICMTALNLGYSLTYQARLDREEAKKETQNETISTEGTAKKNVGYYLVEQKGFIIVYLSDKETVYQYTSIHIDHLPEGVRQEVRDGKYISNTKELYAFLENYTS